VPVLRQPRGAQSTRSGSQKYECKRCGQKSTPESKPRGHSAALYRSLSAEHEDLPGELPLPSSYTAGTLGSCLDSVVSDTIVASLSLYHSEFEHSQKRVHSQFGARPISRGDAENAKNLKVQHPWSLPGRRAVLPPLVNAPPKNWVHSQTGADAWPQLVEGSAHECSTQGQHVL